MASRSAYNGPRRKLILAFDVGTVDSGISYSVLDCGEIPEIKIITRFPYQEQVGGESRVPTIIYYDRSGRTQAVGAEAMREGIHEQAEDEQWFKAERYRFKIHLISRAGPSTSREISNDIPLLPLNKTVVDVFADFLAYLLQCASKYIQETHVDGIDLWKGQINFVLSHPNGWEGTQQSEMRRAAILAGLIPDTTAGHSRLSFVSEGEATVHFAIQNGLLAETAENEGGVMIVDTNSEGGTINVSSYCGNTSTSNATFEEVAAPQCHFHDSPDPLVSIHARKFLENYLAGSPFVNNIEHIARCFDKTTKVRFRKAEEAQYVKFGSLRDNDTSHNIRSGQLKLSGRDVASFFKPSIDCIVNAVMDQKNTSHKFISHIVLVGRFADIDYIFDQIRAALAPAGLNTLRAENHGDRAISNGAISFYLAHFMTVQDPDKAEEEYHRLFAENRRLKDELQKAEDKNGAMRHANDEVNLTRTRELQRTQEELRRVEAENRALRHANREVDQARSRHRENATALLNLLTNVKRELDNSLTLPEIQGEENVGEHHFRTTANLLSIPELSRANTSGAQENQAE